MKEMGIMLLAGCLYVFESQIIAQSPTIGVSKEGEIVHLSANDLPQLLVFLPQKENAKGAAVIVCPGGGYGGRSDEGEGIIPAKKLNEAGITAFVLKYRLPNGTDTIPLNDAQSSIRYVKSHSKMYHIDPRKIGIMGFSAGGHLASTAGTHFKNKDERPDFMVLAYPVISMSDDLAHQGSRTSLLGNDTTPEKIELYSNEFQVTDSTPGAFITHAMDDPGVKVENSLYFYAPLKQHHVPAELFLYAKGGHAYGIFNDSADVQWIDECITWIKAIKWVNHSVTPSRLPSPVAD